MRCTFLFVCLTLKAMCNYGQATAFSIDSLRQHYRIPEVNYAIVSADSILEIQALGVRKVNSQMKASLNDIFRIGSNTKAITAFLAALLVKQGKINWDTRFFDLFPELKKGSRKNYHDITLLQLLNFRTCLPKYTYTDPHPSTGQLRGTEEEQRLGFAKWALAHNPNRTYDSISFSNPGYVMAGLMLEKACGKPYEQMVTEMGWELGFTCSFGQPNCNDGNQTWGHTEHLKPEPPANNQKLNWLLPAGNISFALPEYIKFIQIHLRGLQDRSTVLSQSDFQFLHFGFSRWSLGWLNNVDDSGRRFSFNEGNPGSFISLVYVYPSQNRAFILFCNAQTADAEQGLQQMLDLLRQKFLVK